MNQQKRKIKIVTINLDYNLARNEADLGDVKRRNIEYGNRIDNIFSITHTPKKMGLKYKRLSEEVEVFPTSSFSPILFVFDALKIAKRIFGKYKIDLVLTQDPFVTGLVGYILKKRYGCVYLIHFHGDFWDNSYWLKSKWYNFMLLPLSKFLVKRADGIRVMSNGIKEKLVAYGISQEKIRVIPTPVDVKKFRFCNPNRIKEIRNTHKHKQTIINVARRDKSKDFSTLFKAIKLTYEKCRNLAFIQIAGGFYLPEKIINDSSLLLTSKGRIEYGELIDYYHASDIYVSSSCHESFGKVLVEAMACGLPVIATATTGSKDIVVDGETGFLVPIGDADALSKKIIYLLTHPEEAKSMGQKGRELVREKFDRETLIYNIVEFWNDLVKNNRKESKKSLLIITRRLDRDDGQTGFFYLWTEKFANRLKTLKVICLEKGNIQGLPKNVEVFSMGKERGKNRIREFINFQKGAFKFISKVDGVFCHMNPIYTILIAPYAKIFRKKIIPWYSHKAINWPMRLMHSLTNIVVTPSPEGLGLRSKKKITLGHGIDMQRFQIDFSKKREDVFEIISVGRFSRIKDYETLIKAIEMVKKEKNPSKDIKLDLIFRQPETDSEKQYFAYIKDLIREKGLESNVDFLGTVPNRELAGYYMRAGASVNLCPTGSPDKVVLEAMACGLPALACNRTFAGDFSRYTDNLLFEEKNAKDLAQKLYNLIEMDRLEIEEMGEFLRKQIEERHNLDILVGKIINLF